MTERLRDAMKLTNTPIENSISSDRYELAVQQMRARHFAEHEQIHDGSGRREELPSDMTRRHANERQQMDLDRDRLGVMEWKRLYGA